MSHKRGKGSLSNIYKQLREPSDDELKYAAKFALGMPPNHRLQLLSRAKMDEEDMMR